MPLQVASLAAGAPGTQLLFVLPPEHVSMPVLAHAPVPQLVMVATKSSSAVPLQSSSIPLQVASFAAGVPGEHVLLVLPPEQISEPAATHAPTPQLVGVAT